MKGDPPEVNGVWILIFVVLAGFWGAVCFGIPFMRHLMMQIFHALAVLFNV
jgi:hypothetical protein